MESVPAAMPLSIWPRAILLPSWIAASRLVPQARVEYQHEFEDDPQSVTSSFALDASGTRYALVGGGLSLAASVERTGLADYIAAQGQGLEDLPAWVLVLCIATVVVFLSEIASNVATATTVVPVLSALAIGAGLAPVPLVLAACFAASCGFMLPVATPPNAIVYGTGRVTAGQMARAGFLLNVMGILFITAVTCGIIIPFIGAK